MVAAETLHDRQAQAPVAAALAVIGSRQQTAGGRLVVGEPQTVVVDLNLKAGGTASLPERIGRQRTAWLALSGCRIDARTALDWGLVDEVVE